MKKIFFGIMIIALITLSVSSQSILIKSPTGGSKWVQGQTMKIIWVKKGGMNAFVKIRLLNSPGKTKAFAIAEKVNNKGKFEWEIPGNVKNGKYFIRVKTKDNKVFNDSAQIEIGEEKKAGNPGNNNLPSINPNAGNQLHPKYMKKNVLVIDPVAVKFKPERVTINYGESVKILFHYKDTMKAHIYNRTVYTGDLLSNQKYPEFSSFIMVKPEKSSRYELNLSSAFNKITKSCKIIVNGGPTPPPPAKKKYPYKDPKLPNVSIFKSVPDLVPFDSRTILKLSATNTNKIVIKNDHGLIIFTWSGTPGTVLNKEISVKLTGEKSKWELEASNANGNHYGTAWARWKSVIRDFSVKSINNKKIVFHYDYSLSEKSKIKHYNPVTQKWETIVELNCYSKSCKGEREVNFDSGKFKLVLLGREGVVESNIIKVN